MALNPLEQLGRDIGAEHANGPIEAWAMELVIQQLNELDQSDAPEEEKQV